MNQKERKLQAFICDICVFPLKRYHILYCLTDQKLLEAPLDQILHKSSTIIHHFFIIQPTPLNYSQAICEELHQHNKQDKCRIMIIAFLNLQFFI